MRIFRNKWHVRNLSKHPYGKPDPLPVRLINHIKTHGNVIEAGCNGCVELQKQISLDKTAAAC